MAPTLAPTLARELSPHTVLARGTLLIEFRHEPADHPRNILRYSARDPWPAGQTLCLDPDATLRLMLTQGRQALSYALPLGPLIPGEWCWRPIAGTRPRGLAGSARN